MPAVRTDWPDHLVDGVFAGMDKTAPKPYARILEVDATRDVGKRCGSARALLCIMGAVREHVAW
jgi:hypothetical protein